MILSWRSRDIIMISDIITLSDRGVTRYRRAVHAACELWVAAEARRIDATITVDVGDLASPDNNARRRHALAGE